MTMPSIVHYACDIGSIQKGRFGWARAAKVGKRTDVSGGSSIDVLIREVMADLSSGTHALTFGVESPLFLPVPDRSEQLGSGRIGDRDRSCFAPAGGYVAALGVHQLAFILKHVRRGTTTPTLDWAAWEPRPDVILFWEAFVSGKAHSASSDAGGHLRDAASAAVLFDSALAEAQAGGNVVRVPEGTLPLSLVGAALLWAGWSTDLDLLVRDALVVKPTAPFTGHIAEVR